MRGIMVDYTPIILINEIYYNDIRQHRGLDGATPANAAGIRVYGENKWMGLLKRSIKE